MKNFLELLATKLELEIVVNGKRFNAGLLDHLTFQSQDTVQIDGVEVLPKYNHLAVNGVLEIREPFYCWLHRVSGQGWLLMPH